MGHNYALKRPTGYILRTLARRSTYQVKNFGLGFLRNIRFMIKLPRVDVFHFYTD